MSKTFGTNNGLTVYDCLDSDCELLINVTIQEDDISCAATWLTEEDAKKLITHLQNMFELEEK